MFEIALGSRERKSPYFNSTVKAGVKSFTIYNHMYLPVSFGDPEAEYKRLTEGVALWDVAAERQVEVVGPDATALVRHLTPRDLSKQKIGQGKYAPICDHFGRILGDPIILRLDETRYWLSISDGDLLFWAQAIGSERGYDAQVFEPDVSPLAVQGPKAEDVVAALLGDEVRDIKFFWFREMSLQGIDLIVQRSGWSKQGGFELYLQNSAEGPRLWDLVMQAGEPFGIGPGAPNGTERVESCLISIGADTDWGANPLEMGFQPYMNLDREDDFIGKDALNRIIEHGTTKLLTGIYFSEDLVGPATEPWRAFSGDVEIGEVRTAVQSPKFGRGIGFAYVDRLQAEKLMATGDRLEVHSEYGTLTGTLTPLPFQ